MSGFEGFPPPQGSGGGGGYGMGDDPTFGDVTADTLVLDAANGDAFLSRAAAGRVRAGTSPTNANGQLQAALLLTASSTMALANATGLELGDVRTVSWGDSTLYTSTKDLYLRRASASVLQIDADGAGAAATLAVANLTAVGTGPLTVASGSGDDLFLNARGANKLRLGASAASFDTQSIRLGDVSTPQAESWTSQTTVTLTESSATKVFGVDTTSDSVWSGLVKIDTYATDGTEDQLRSGLYLITVKDDGGTISGTATTVSEQAETSSGTLTQTITVSDGSGVANINCNAVSSLTQTTLNCRVSVISGTLNIGGTTTVGNP